ncbi:MAG: peptidoglycan editing factor PgeF [Nitrospirae bacterium]|nr:peptidoglycan editing factor PgeF [Nitrospirota bacterium]
MHRVIVPDIFPHSVTAFFTAKDPGSNIDDISSMTGICRTHIYLPVQKHTDRVLVLNALREPSIADAVVTNERGILIGVQAADCVPLLLYDPGKKVAAAIHAGWRGTASSIVRKTIDVMMNRFSCEPGDIMVAIGPSIRGCCYAVGPDVIEAIAHANGNGSYCMIRQGRSCIDLAIANRDQALCMNIPESNIWVSRDCTFCNPERYFSYRYAKGSTGRQAAFIAVR